MGPPVRSSMTTKPGRFWLTLPRPYVTHDPRHGLPDRMRPEFIISIAEPWMGDSAYIECRKAMSSTQVPTCGNRSDTILPHWPYGENFQRGSTMRPWLRWPPRPKVFTAMVLPSMPYILGL